MGQLFLGYASFVYFICEKGHEVQCHAKNRITFWYDDKSRDEYDSYQVRGMSDFDCGYVVTDTESIDERFEGDSGLINVLKTDCVRIKRIIQNKITRNDEIRVSHCKKPYHKTTIRNGEIVECKCSKEGSP